MLVWWHWVQTASTVSLPAPCGSAAGRPCSWAWAASGINAKTAAAIREKVDGPDMFNLPTACSQAFDYTPPELSCAGLTRVVGWALRVLRSGTPAGLAARCPRGPSAWAKSRDIGAHLHKLDRRFCPSYPSRRCRSSRLRQLEIDIRAIDDDVLDEHARLDLFALEE